MEIAQLLSDNQICYSIATEAILAAAALAANVGASMWQNRQNRKENDKAREFEEEQINKQNEYNTPANQVARFEAAGLNPYLQDGSSYASSGMQKETARPYPTHYEKLPLHEGLGMYLSAKKSLEEIDSIKLDNQLKKVNLNTAKTEERLKALTLSNQLLLNDEYLGSQRGSYAKNAWWGYDDPAYGNNTSPLNNASAYNRGLLSIQDFKNKLIANQSYLTEMKKRALEEAYAKYDRSFLKAHQMFNLPSNPYQFLAQNRIAGGNVLPEFLPYVGLLNSGLNFFNPFKLFNLFKSKGRGFTPYKPSPISPNYDF